MSLPGSSLAKRLCLALCLALPLAGVARAQDAAGSADHPLIPRYAETEIRDYATSEFDEFSLITGKSLPDGSFEASQPLEGRTTHILYRAPRDRSVLEVFRNYEATLKEAGFETLYTCDKAGCGPRFNGAMNPAARYNGLIYPDQQRYLAAKLTRAEGDVYVSLYITAFEPEARPFILLDVVEIAPMDQRMVVIEASEIEESLARDGRIAIYGILFEFDSAAILPESEPQIEQLATLMKDSGALQVLIVGHTDGEGAFDYNLSLSQRRAQAVVEALTAKGIEASRLTPAGAGMVAPVATNRTEEGRAKNRRVEIVELVRN